MDKSEPSIAGALIDLSKLHTAIIDSSSIIYMQKAGYLLLVNDIIHLLTTPSVYSETGLRSGIDLIGCDIHAGMAADDELIYLAYKSGFPLISEDKRLLQELKKKGKQYFNSLMILLLLRMRKRINDEEFEGYKDELKSVARYSSMVWEFGQEVYREILRREF